MAAHGAPIGWRKKKLQEKIGPWRPIDTMPPPEHTSLLMAWETIDCGWLLETGWLEKGSKDKYVTDGGRRTIWPHYWMYPEELLDILEEFNYPKDGKGNELQVIEPKHKKSLIERIMSYVKAR